MSSGACKVIERDLRVSEWMECDAQMTQLQHCPCCCGGRRWTVTHKFCGSGINEEFCRGATGIKGDAVWPGAIMVDEPGVVDLMDAKAVVAFEQWSPTSLCVRRRRT